MSDHPVAGSGGLPDLQRQRRRARPRELSRLVRLVWNASSRPHPTPCYHFNKYYYLILTSRRGLARRLSARPRPSQAPPHPAAPRHSTILAEGRGAGGDRAQWLARWHGGAFVLRTNRLSESRPVLPSLPCAAGTLALLPGPHCPPVTHIM